MKSNQFYQHGDVLIKKCESIPEGCKQIQTNVLAEGEVTGHYHALVPKGTELTRCQQVPGLRVVKADTGDTYIQTDTEIDIVHQEHRRITLDPGIYQIDLVREYDYDAMETRRVVD